MRRYSGVVGDGSDGGAHRDAVAPVIACSWSSRAASPRYRASLMMFWFDGNGMAGAGAGAVLFQVVSME